MSSEIVIGILSILVVAFAIDRIVRERKFNQLLLDYESLKEAHELWRGMLMRQSRTIEWLKSELGAEHDKVKQ